MWKQQENGKWIHMKTKKESSESAPTEKPVLSRRVKQALTASRKAHLRPKPPILSRKSYSEGQAASVPPIPSRPHSAANLLSRPKVPPVQPHEFVRATYDFTGRTSKELTFRSGEDFRVLYNIDALPSQPSWLVCQHVTSKAIGYVPLSYVKPSLSTQIAPTLPVRSVRTIIGAQAKTKLTSEAKAVGTRNSQEIYTSAIGKHNGYATDVICIRGIDGRLSGTDFNVRFSGASKKAAFRGSIVDVKVDGNTCFSMVLDAGGVCRFADKSLQGSGKMLSSLSHLKGRHELVYEHRFNKDNVYCVNYIRAHVWIWEHTDHVLVSDVDGTITISDVGGMLNSTLLSRVGFKKGYAHQGVCSLFNAIQHSTKCHFLYLTARPMNLIKETREYIYGLEQTTNDQRRSLPIGPVVTDTTDLLGSFHREVISKSSHVFKTRMLLQLRACFLQGGRDVLAFPVYIASFGNKSTDAAAYEAAGAPRLTTFLIDTYSSIRIMEGTDGIRLDSYSDPRMLRFVLDRINLIMQGKLPMPP